MKINTFVLPTFVLPTSQVDHINHRQGKAATNEINLRPFYHFGNVRKKKLYALFYDFTFGEIISSSTVVENFGV